MCVYMEIHCIVTLLHLYIMLRCLSSMHEYRYKLAKVINLAYFYHIKMTLNGVELQMPSCNENYNMYVNTKLLLI